MLFQIRDNSGLSFFAIHSHIFLKFNNNYQLRIVEFGHFFYCFKFSNPILKIIFYILKKKISENKIEEKNIYKKIRYKN